jgi:hypothetical protein
MRPAEWYGKGVRTLGRTTLEAVRDPLGNRIGADVARVAAMTPQGTLFGVVECFAGSCNRLCSILQYLPRAEGIGFEFDPVIFEMSTRNIAFLDAPIRLFNGDYRQLLGVHRFPAGHRIVAFLAPPWAEALSAETGLDLGSTKQPIAEIIAEIERAYPDTPVL